MKNIIVKNRSNEKLFEYNSDEIPEIGHVVFHKEGYVVSQIVHELYSFTHPIFDSDERGTALTNQIILIVD